MQVAISLAVERLASTKDFEPCLSLGKNISRGSEEEDHCGGHFWIQLLLVNIAEIREINILIFL